MLTEQERKQTEQQMDEAIAQAILEQIEKLGYRKNGIACKLACDAAEKITDGLLKRGTIIPGRQEEVV